MKSSDISDKILIMIVGPSAIGKSTLMDKVTRQHPDFAYVRSFTTRPKRDGELSHYRFLSRDQALELRDNGETITFFEHPTTGDIYGTTAESFPAKYNLLDTLSGSVEMYRDLPFSQTKTIAITTDIDDWQSWFSTRFPTPTDEAKKRLVEAHSSIMWALGDTKTQWLKNRDGQLEPTAKKLIELATTNDSTLSTPSEPRAMLRRIERGIWPKN